MSSREEAIKLKHQHFAQTGAFNLDHAAFFSRLMHERIEDDYSDVINLEAEDVFSFIEPAKKYVEYIIEYISGNS